MKPNERAALILDAAARLIGERGYYGFTVQDLARRCGLTNGGLLHHFGSKDVLLVSLLRDRDRRDSAAILSMAALSGERSATELPLQTIVDLFHLTVVRNSAQPELVRLFAVLQAEAMHPTHPAYDFFLAREASTLAGFTKLLAPHFDKPSSRARQVIAAMIGLEQQWLRSDQGFDLVAEWDRAATILLGAVGSGGETAVPPASVRSSAVASGSMGETLRS